jgi:hypothetical protein
MGVVVARDEQRSMRDDQPGESPWRHCALKIGRLKRVSGQSSHDESFCEMINAGSVEQFLK